MCKLTRNFVSITISTIFFLILLSGCGPSLTVEEPTLEEETSAPVTIVEEAEEESTSNIGNPHIEDTLRIAFTSEPPSLGIYDHSSLISTLMNRLTFNGLTRIHPETLEPILDLAESYSVENDTDWTFVLRKGVKFHNGEELSSADVVASILYAKSIPGATLYTVNMESIEAIDTYTVLIKTSEPYAGLLYDLAYYYNFIVPKSLLDAGNNFSENPIGTGPYVLTEWNFGNYIKYDAFPDYFDKDHVAKISHLIFSMIPEGSSRTIALEAGEIDLVWDVSGADVASLKSNPLVQVVEIDSVDNVILFFNNDREPWTDSNLRNAIAAAINRQDVIDGALNGYGKVNFSVIASGLAGSTDKDAIPYDLDLARSYLQKWGGDPASIKLTIFCSNETRVAIATVIQSNLNEIGIQVAVEPVDTASYMAAWKAGEFDAVIGSWSPSNALSYTQRFHSDRRLTYAGAINSQEIDAMVNEMKSTLDPEARNKIIEDIVSKINQVSPQVSLYQSLWFRAHNADLLGVYCDKTGFARFEDMYWRGE